MWSEERSWGDSQGCRLAGSCTESGETVGCEEQVLGEIRRLALESGVPEGMSPQWALRSVSLEPQLRSGWETQKLRDGI